jgi:hypothetical protein
MPFDPLHRRDFITLLGGAASTPSAASQRIAAFVQRLRELRWIEGHNIAIEYRWGQGRGPRHPRSRMTRDSPRRSRAKDCRTGYEATREAAMAAFGKSLWP